MYRFMAITFFLIIHSWLASQTGHANFELLLNHPDHDLMIDGFNIRVENHVFSPDSNLTFSTSYVIENLPNLNGKAFLDVGTGTGILSLHAARDGAARVVAVDISDEALHNTQENRSRYHFDERIEITRSDLLNQVTGKFDVICANLPILDQVWDASPGESLNLLRRFLAEAPAYLTPGGKIYFPWGSFADITPVRELLKKSGWQFEEQSKVVMEYNWTLFTLFAFER